MKTFIQDGHTILLRAVRKLSGAETGWAVASDGLRLVIEEIASRDWASLTFSGQRHCIELRLEGQAPAVEAALERLAANLGEVDGGLGSHFIAEAAVTSAAVLIEGPLAVARLTIEALTLEA